MTVSSTTTKNSYSGNGSTHSFAYGFKIFADADLTVIIRSSTGVETVRTLNTHYIVTNAGNDSGGNVLFKFNTGTSSDAHFSSSDFRPASGETVVIRRNLTLTQGTDYVENDPFPAESHENALDRVTFITQQLQEELDRSIKLSRTNTITSPEFTTSSTDRANKVLSFDSSGEISVTQELGTFKGDWAASTSYLVRDIVKDTSTNNIFIVTSAHTSSGSQPLTTNANSAKYSLIVDAASSTTAQNNAAASATASANSATASANSATSSSNSSSTSTTKASEASTSASNAASSATAAASSATSAASSLSTFQGQYHGAASSNPSSNLDAGDLYFNTSDGELKVYTGSAWVSTKPTSSEQTNINTLAASAVVTDMSLLATSDVIADMALLADSDVIADMNTLAVTDIINDINTLATSDIVSDLNTLATSDFVSDLNLLASSSNVTAINNVSGSITNVNTVASNLSGVNSFAERYRVQSGVPSSDNDVGDLVFDTATNTLKVFSASGFQNAGSSVNGTSARFHYDISGTPTTVTGSDANGNTLAYDAGFVDVYVNGVRMSPADITVTSGSSVVFASALADGDEVDIVAFGTFSLASMNASNLDSGTVPSARVSGSYTGITGTGALNAGSITSGFGNIDTGSSTITTTGAITGGSLVVDNITIDGTQIDLSSGDLTIDVAGDIILDADGGDFKFQDNGSAIFHILTSATETQLFNQTQDADIVFKGDDGGNAITALTLDMSAAGQANFNSNIFTGNTAEFVDGTGTGDKGIQLNPIGMVVATRNGGISGIFGRQASNGAIIQLRKDGVSLGEIGVNSADLSIYNTISGHTGLRFGNGNIMPTDNSGGISDNTADLGESAYRFKNFYVAGNIYLGGTGTANALDDYEEGTFTAQISTDTTYVGDTAQSGVYTKIGDICFIQIRFQRTGTLNSGSNARFSLPFTSANNGVQASGFRGSVENIDTSMVGIGGTIAANNTILYLNEMTAATTGHNVNGSDLGENFQVQIQGFYKTA